ncbi:MAG: hypothetical protein ACI9YL_001171 [Luteibaculaceae bacterium]|jgi:hypothetical protein
MLKTIIVNIVRAITTGPAIAAWFLSFDSIIEFYFSGFEAKLMEKRIKSSIEE